MFITSIQHKLLQALQRDEAHSPNYRQCKVCSAPAEVLITKLKVLVCLDCANEIGKELEADLTAHWVHGADGHPIESGEVKG